MATIIASAPAHAQSIVTDSNLDSTVEAHIVAGDGFAQTNAANVDANVPSTDATITNEGVATGNFENNNNAAPASAFGNRDGASASLVTIGSSTLLDDGIAIATGSVNSAGAITASSTNATMGITGTDITNGSVDVSGNSATASVVINEGSGTYEMSITGSEPVGYANLATNNASVTTDLSRNAANVADLSGTLLLSSAQSATSVSDSQALATGNDIFADLDRTTTADITGTVTVDGNTVSSAFTGNARDASIGLAADDASTSVTAAISNAQLLDANNNWNSAYTGQNSILGNIWNDTAGENTTSFVDSSLSVSSNSLSANATGNTASTGITLADGLAYNTAAANTANALIDALDIDANKIADVQANGGLVGVNSQLLKDGFLSAVGEDNSVSARVQSLETSSIDVSGNRLVASALGNDLTASIASGDGSALFDASAVLASRQESNNTLVTGISDNNDVSAAFGYDWAGTFVDSSVTLDGNVVAASATGNKARQSISLSATDLNSGTTGTADLTGDLLTGGGDATVAASGAIVVASEMANVDADVSARNSGSDISIDAGDSWNETATNTSTAITGNLQQAYAVGSDAGNSITLNGVDVGTGAGISNVQTNDGLSSVSAYQSATANTYYDWDLVSGSGDISGNSQSAIAKGTVAANSVLVDAQTIYVDAGNGIPANTSVGGLWTNVESAFGIANTQQVLDNVTAETVPSDSNAYRMYVWGTADSSTVNLSNNSVMAQAQGVVATDVMTINVGTFGSWSGEDMAAVSNLQTVDGADILATARGNGSDFVRTDIGRDVLASSVETSSNQVLASAESARATNALTVNATSIDGGGWNNGYSDGYYGDYNDVYAGFAVTNTQLAGVGNVTATLRDGAGGAFQDSTAIHTDIGNNVTSSSVASDANLLQALASSNKATNLLTVDATSLSQVTSGLSNVQQSEQDVSALIGFAGNNGTAGFSVTGIVTAGVWNGNISGLTADQKTAFINQYSSQGGWTYDAGTGAVSFTSVGSGSLTLPVGGTAGSYNSGGVLIDVGGQIVDSSVTVDGNAVQGSAIGNTAANRVTVSATTLDSLDNYGAASVWTDATGTPEAYATADTTLASLQVLDLGSSSTTEVYTTFGIDAGTDTVISNSQLSVSGNSLYGEAIGNTVTNNLTVAADDQTLGSASGALANSQDGTYALVDATSDMEVFSNVVSGGSNVAMDGNANTALAVVNSANNTVTANSVNSASTSQANAYSWVDDGSRDNANGSFVLVNGQASSGTLNSTATTNVYNVGAIDGSTTGIVDGTVSASGNATRAESTANRATNTLALSADANLGSTGALVNQQISGTTVNADASSYVSLGVNGTDPLEAVDGSSVSVEGNTTLALARGNSASNTLNYTAGANYQAQSAAATTNSTYAQADAAMLNDQSNYGAVTATATGSTMIALNTLNGAATGSVLNASVSNSNNSVAAYAYGNSASNVLMLSALNTGTANAALGNQQLNTGAVTATATSVSFTMSSVGTVGASSMMNSGNVASATAIGNSSISFIGGQ